MAVVAESSQGGFRHHFTPTSLSNMAANDPLMDDDLVDYEDDAVLNEVAPAADEESNKYVAA
mgnify:CR=1 FL=1